MIAGSHPLIYADGDDKYGANRNCTSGALSPRRATHETNRQTNQKEDAHKSTKGSGSVIDRADGQLCDHAKVMNYRVAMDEWAPDHARNSAADDHSAGMPGTKA